MNITFDGAEKIGAHRNSNVDRETTAYRSSESTRMVSQNIFALDISGTVMDNSAYAGHGRTAEEVMQEAGQQDITARRNYMAVMSNSMSDEDFAKLQEEGFHPGSTDIETVVTIVDQIKAAMLKGGTEVVGYTDNIDDAKLTEITGSETFANELKKVFSEKDIPLTKENVRDVMKAFHTMEDMQELSEGSVKYMIENDLPPTVENLYTARFSAVGNGDRQGKGYYATGGVSGYMAKKPENIDYEQLMPQIEKTIEKAGYSVNEETISDAKWLIEKGIPFHEGTFMQKQKMRELSLPETMEDFVKSAASAIADGTSPMKADLTRKESCLEQAISVKEQTDRIDDRAVEVIRTANLPFNLKNLFAASDALKETNASVEAVSASFVTSTSVQTTASAFVRNTTGTASVLESTRILNEVRLSMTVSANMHLLKKGYQIDTAPMEELLANLKEQQEAYNSALVQETDVQVAAQKSSLYQQTLYTLESIRFAPVAIVAEVAKENTLKDVESYAKARITKYQKAEESYETLMTAPRKDMGDSIIKAFRNVDDILSDMQKDPSEENRRAVRILGYNSMEITEENFEAVKEADALLSQVVEGMKPATVLSMIREGINPLTMSIEELSDYLGTQQVEGDKEIESYSRFLYQLEQKNGISEEERSAYIGIYRLLRQVEKGDNAAIGAVMQTGAEQTLSNLLTSVRSSKKNHMDYQVSDAFGGVSAKSSNVQSITDQIEKGYIGNRQQLREAIADEETAKAGAEFDRQIYEGVRVAMGSEEAVLRQLTDYDQPVTADYLMAAGELLKGASETFRKLKKLTKEGDEDVLKESDFPEKLTSKSQTLNVFEEMTDKLLEAVEKESFEGEYTSLDLKAMSSLYKQITYMKSMAREENYEIPVEIEGNLTAINLKMIHKGSGESKVTVTFETEKLGKNAAEFTFSEDKLTGYGICDSLKGSELLNQHKDMFTTLLEKEGISSGDIRFMEGKSLDLTEFGLKAEKDRISGSTPDVLYKAAKAYIGYIQEIGK